MICGSRGGSSRSERFERAPARGGTARHRHDLQRDVAPVVEARRPEHGAARPAPEPLAELVAGVVQPRPERLRCAAPPAGRPRGPASARATVPRCNSSARAIAAGSRWPCARAPRPPGEASVHPRPVAPRAPHRSWTRVRAARAKAPSGPIASSASVELVSRQRQHQAVAQHGRRVRHPERRCPGGRGPVGLPGGEPVERVQLRDDGDVRDLGVPRQLGEQRVQRLRIVAGARPAVVRPCDLGG